MSSFRTVHPSSAFNKLMEVLSATDTTATPSTAVRGMRKVNERKKSVRGAVGFSDSDGGGALTGEEEEEEEESELFQDKKKSKQEARRLKKEMRKKEVGMTRLSIKGVLLN